MCVEEVMRMHNIIYYDVGVMNVVHMLLLLVVVVLVGVCLSYFV